MLPQPLKNLGFLVGTRSRGGDGLFNITTEGAMAVEDNEDLETLHQLLIGPTVNIDRSTNVYGNVSNSNVAVNSPLAEQSVSVGQLDPAVETLLDRIVAVLQTSQSLSPAEVSLRIRDVETLRVELAQPAPRGGLVRAILSTLADGSEVSALVLQLAPYFPGIIDAIVKSV